MLTQIICHSDGSPCKVVTLSSEMSFTTFDYHYLDKNIRLPDEVGGVQVGLALVAAQAVLVDRAILSVDPLLLEDLER